MSGTGFSLLLEVANLPDDYTSDKELLDEAVLLLNSKWNLDGITSQDKSGKWWGWLYCTRFMVANATIARALGDMCSAGHIKFYRGPAQQSQEEAIRYQQIKKKWRVKDTAEETDTSSDGSGRETQWFKRQRR